MKKSNVVFYLACTFLLLLGLFFDKSFSLWFAQHRIGFLNSVMQGFSFFGKWFIVLIVSSSFFLWQKNRREGVLPLCFSLFISMIIVFLLKIIVMRARPEVALNLFSELSSSFPSGHATAVFSVLPILSKFSKIKWFWLFFAVIVAFSRLYLGVHYLTDVVSGALIGYSIGLLVVWYKKKKKKV